MRKAVAVFVLSAIAVINSAAQKQAATVWVATPKESARIERVESGIAPVQAHGEAPIQLSLQEWMKLLKIPGLSVAVFENNHVVWSKTYGVKEIGKSDPVTLETRFQAGSISKPVFAMGMMHFVERGKFLLDENVNDKLVSWKVPDNEYTKTQKVTLRRLLSHTAGTTVHGFPGYAVGAPVPTVVQVLKGEKPANTAPVSVDMIPGTKEVYSGGGVTIAQLLMTDVLKKPFPQIMAETVIGPLGLKNSSYEQTVTSNETRASGHRSDGKMVEGRWHVYPEMAAAGLWTTATDLSQVAIEMSQAKSGKSNRVISQETAQRMLTLSPNAESVGLSWFLDPRYHTDQFGHNGADEGFQASLVAFSDSGSGVAIMTNSDNGHQIFDRLTASVAKEYGWKNFHEEEPSAMSTIAVLASLRGTNAALAEYKHIRMEGKQRTSPADLNALGYELLQSGKTQDAVNVFRANVEQFPEDSNVYDSLGEGLMTAGDKTGAIENYRKSLKLDPKNTNAVKMLEKMGTKP